MTSGRLRIQNRRIAKNSATNRKGTCNRSPLFPSNVRQNRGIDECLQRLGPKISEAVDSNALYFLAASRARMMGRKNMNFQVRITGASSSTPGPERMRRLNHHPNAEACTLKSKPSSASANWPASHQNNAPEAINHSANIMEIHRHE